MQRLDTLLQVLCQTSNPAADQALGEALINARGDVCEKLAESLMQRNSDVGLVWLIRAYDRLSDYSRNQLARSSATLFSALRLAVRDQWANTRANAVELIKQSGNPRLGYLLTLAIHDQVPAIRRRAGLAFRHLAQQLLVDLDEGIQEDDDDNVKQQKVRTDDKHWHRQDDLRQFLAAVHGALENFELHGRGELVELAIWLTRYLPDKTWQLIIEPGSKVGKMAVEIMRRSSDPRLVPFTYRAMRYPVLAVAVVQVIADQTSQGFMERWIDCRFLGADHVIHKNLARIKELRWLGESLEPLMRLKPGLQIEFIDLLSYMGLGPGLKVQIIEALLQSGDEQVKEAALLLLLRLDNEEANGLLRQICSEHDQSCCLNERLFRIVRDELKVRDPQRLESLTDRSEQLLEQITGQDHGQVEYFERFWEVYNRLDSSELAIAARALRNIDEKFSEHLGNKLGSANAKDRLRALKMARDLKFIVNVDDLIRKLCKDSNRIVRSCAVAALVDLPGPESQQLLIQSVDDPDPRVQANAIEALEAIKYPHLHRLIEPKLNSQHNRVLAGVVKTLLDGQTVTALRALDAMLNHPESLFRRSGLWVVGATMLKGLLGRLNILARQDPDLTVRQMAEKLITASDPPNGQLQDGVDNRGEGQLQQTGAGK